MTLIQNIGQMKHNASDDILYFDGKTTKKGWMTRVRYTDKEFKNGDIYFTSLSDIKCKTVTHWMPLPEPPKQ